ADGAAPVLIGNGPEGGNMTGALLGLALLTAAEPKPEAVQAEWKKLEGTWKIVTAERDGKPVEELKGGTVVFQPPRMVLKGKGEPRNEKFQVDPEKGPKWFDLYAGYD